MNEQKVDLFCVSLSVWLSRRS